ncbi:hypothetical protein CR513_18061, partial [Mucuna pruriens]
MKRVINPPEVMEEEEVEEILVEQMRGMINLILNVIVSISMEYITNVEEKANLVGEVKNRYYF